MTKTNDTLERSVAVVPNGIRLGLRPEDEILSIDFFGAMDAKGTPKEIIGSYAFSFKRALQLAEQIKDAVSRADKS